MTTRPAPQPVAETLETRMARDLAAWRLAQEAIRKAAQR